MQMPTTDQPNNRRMLLGKWIEVEILITGCHTFSFHASEMKNIVIFPDTSVKLMLYKRLN